MRGFLHMMQAALALLCFLFVHEVTSVANCAAKQCTSFDKWGGYVLGSSGKTTCGCSDKNCDCAQAKGLMCLTYAEAYIIGTDVSPATGNCPDLTVDCRGCPTSASSTTTPPPTPPPTTASPGASGNHTSAPGTPSSTDANGRPVPSTTMKSMTKNLEMWQIGLIIASGVLMLFVIICVLVSWRKACVASKGGDTDGTDDARFYRENYRSQTFQQGSQPRRSSMTQSMMNDPRRHNSNSITHNAPVASF
ncbi:Aste57867_9481 [Aphanomyces stellatus]|uniref:Aste57867_9481 protein n=1 Tax=Aphanomyces stellatus TaxID=120398 RepID=A0A485KMZ9_9STRA|nr:hypothetical protein As57867_009444 [Aphanomyces stellatus]VFT86360.1 Aste57867_9481 [Aphanomyces stellatus]